jgi:hypothetical protein
MLFSWKCIIQFSMKRQIINPEQQPGRRHYRRERNQYYRDEERDFRQGADYLPGEGAFDHYQPEIYDDYGTPQNREDWRHYSERLYMPSNDYGYDGNAYYYPGNRHQTTGYGNEFSPQGRDFEHWVHETARYRNYPEERFRPYNEREFPRHQIRDHNRDFQEGLYDSYPGEEHRRRPMQGPYERELPYVNKRHNRTSRHLEIVVPFKDDDDYGRNYYNESEGFGSNEMVYPGPKRGIRDSWPYSE